MNTASPKMSYSIRSDLNIHLGSHVGFSFDPILRCIFVPNSSFSFKFDQETVVKGDAKSASIAGASVLAKVARDRYMIELDEKYPMYGFARNKGYGTAEHIAALKEYGPCPEHRRSFIQGILSGV